MGRVGDGKNKVIRGARRIERNISTRVVVFESVAKEIEHQLGDQVFVCN